MSDPGDLNGKLIDEFRANGGHVGGPFEGSHLLLLHHIGAKSGTERVTPLMYLPVGDKYAIFASNGGGPAHPAWYHNLRANPQTTIEVGDQARQVKARVTDGAERDEIWTRQKQAFSFFAGFERDAAPRQIPVIVLEPAD